MKYECFSFLSSLTVKIVGGWTNWRRDGRGRPDRNLNAFLTQHFLSGVCDLLTGWEGLFAPGARKTLLMVGLTQCRDHL